MEHPAQKRIQQYLRKAEAAEKYRLERIENRKAFETDLKVNGKTYFTVWGASLFIAKKLGKSDEEAREYADAIQRPVIEKAIISQALVAINKRSYARFESNEDSPFIHALVEESIFLAWLALTYPTLDMLVNQPIPTKHNRQSMRDWVTYKLSINPSTRQSELIKEAKEKYGYDEQGTAVKKAWYALGLNVRKK